MNSTDNTPKSTVQIPDKLRHAECYSGSCPYNTAV